MKRLTEIYNVHEAAGTDPEVQRLELKYPNLGELVDWWVSQAQRHGFTDTLSLIDDEVAANYGEVGRKMNALDFIKIMKAVERLSGESSASGSSTRITAVNPSGEPIR